MPLKLCKRPKSPNWIMRGTVRGQSIEESTGTTCKATAEAVRIKKENELLTESVWGKTHTMTFAQAALDYMNNDGEKRFMKQLLTHFNTTLLRFLGQEAIDNAAKKLLPHGSNATRNRQVYTPMSAILRHAARKGWCKVPIFARPKQPPGVIRNITPNEADRLIDNCADHLRPLVVFLLYTGARAGEALWLDWSQIDLKLKQVTFPKTKNGQPRSVPLHPRVLEELLQLEHRQGCVFLTAEKRSFRAKSDYDRSALAHALGRGLVARVAGQGSRISRPMIADTLGRLGTIRLITTLQRYKLLAAGGQSRWSCAMPIRMCRSMPTVLIHYRGENQGKNE